ncbi:hypothetical protein [Burkholderia lata]|nr:hypothetical protein [Burkholderia lata]
MEKDSVVEKWCGEQYAQPRRIVAACQIAAAAQAEMLLAAIIGL